jgi:hypothetical protein
MSSATIRPLSLLASLRALLFLVLPLCGSLQAQQNAPRNVPMVAGHFEATVGFNSFDVTVFAMQLPNGRSIGWMSYERVFDNGTTYVRDAFEEPIDDLMITDNKAYLNVGQFYFLLVDSGNGGSPAVDGFQYVKFLSPTTLPVMVGFLDQLMSFFGPLEFTVGNVHVQS